MKGKRLLHPTRNVVSKLVFESADILQGADGTRLRVKLLVISKLDEV
jgi:hypothetical protein